MTKDAFPLPNFGPKLRELAAEVSHGRGFQIMRGVPVARCALFGVQFKSSLSSANLSLKSQLFNCTTGCVCCRYKRLQLVILWWGIGQHVGRVLPMNRFGHLINHLHQVISSDGACSCLLHITSSGSYFDRWWAHGTDALLALTSCL